MEKDYAKIAGDNFRKGYNCAQSVCLAFAEETGLCKDTILKLSSSFGGGMGRMREVCGAVSSMFIIAGILKGYTEPGNDEIKGAHYKLIQALAKEFRAKHNTIICRELLGLTEEKISPIPSKRTEEYYAKRPCEMFVRTAADIISKKILQSDKK